MADIGRTAVTLRIFGEDLDPDEVTRLLGAQPTASARKGDVHQTRGGREVVARSGSWRIEATIAGDVNAKIAAILAPLTTDLSVWRLLSQRYRCDVFCGLFMRESNEGIDLTPATLALLGERGLRLGLDLYAPMD